MYAVFRRDGFRAKSKSAPPAIFTTRERPTVVSASVKFVQNAKPSTTDKQSSPETSRRVNKRKKKIHGRPRPVRLACARTPRLDDRRSPRFFRKKSFYERQPDVWVSLVCRVRLFEEVPDVKGERNCGTCTKVNAFTGPI